MSWQNRKFQLRPLSIKSLIGCAGLILLTGCQSTGKGSEASQTSNVSGSSSSGLISTQLDEFFSQQARDQFLKQSIEALESQGTSEWQGIDSATAAKWLIKVASPEVQSVQVEYPVENSVDTTQSLVFVGVSYETTTALNLRSGPRQSSQKIGQLIKGEEFNVLAQASGKPWVLVEQEGNVRGYVHHDYIQPAGPQQDLIVSKVGITTFESSDVETTTLEGTFVCRDLQYSFSREEKAQQGEFTACQKQQGTWYIEEGSARIVKVSE
ncbi:putative Bacterial SH3 domain family protein [Vibrio nigripulchritudo MADA3029]|uniref:Bacterial SH3 domain family protein n=2 Tax=Vibrio nigripulchritudo TaxID=28173 RepID=A0AAV2VKR4_9VIBR|nr:MULTISPECIES: SH3 domain-containing protein [Vibrio]UAB69823.1 SH3 domain-containing protein [Vibrio sp. SCSIO 43132]CCN38033.1 putative Bacterial SH3 domain family protein [Vibrio nigripulchritudo AM115]CCN39047.1 putative Bacterial SH3 domain family protein [Vibrio nigripulchritudo FTn2]CCN45134.1 putative Bacterial SH3 domain family protein [Vibrio nigripulchritudo MADA3020]CCN54472.1 putative Bacterial SH3 domain family protein [Vibrio nigripulchritudo MADA3021]